MNDNQQTMTAAAKKSKKDKKNETISLSDLKPGMIVRIHEKINDIDAKGKERIRIQVFEGTVIAIKKPRTAEGSITIRKISDANVGVEKIFPLQSPLIDKIEFVRSLKTRRSKLYHLRDYGKKLKYKKN